MSRRASGYGTPLLKKLGIQTGQTVAWLHAPSDFPDLLGDLPKDLTIQPGLWGPLDTVIFFTAQRDELKRKLPPLKKAIAPAGAAWIAWPKRASGLETDMTEDVVREEALPIGLVDTKVCAIDETWSGLKLVIRKENR